MPTNSAPNNRISLDDDAQTMLVKLCDGNPGALTTLIALLKQEQTIDPDSALGPYGTILSLDVMGIYGPRIWVLFKYVCDSKIDRLVTLFRAHQLGLVSEDAIKAASQEPPSTPPFDMESLIAQIKAQLPAFNVS